MKNIPLFRSLRSEHSITWYILIFGLMNIPLITFLFFTDHSQQIFLYAFIFFYGWFCSTFIEYMLHRFWSKTKGKD